MREELSCFINMIWKMRMDIDNIFSYKNPIIADY